MYLPSRSYPSKSDFGSITSPFFTESSTALLSHSPAAARRLSEYRDSRCEPRQQRPPPWKWTLYQASRSITSPPSSCFSLPGEAVNHEYHGSPSEARFSASNDCFLYGASGPFHAHAFAGAPRSFPGRYTAFSPDSQLLLSAGRNRPLPLGFDQCAEEGVDPKAGMTHGSQQEKETNRAEWTSCHSGESSELRAGSESPHAGRDDEEDAPSSSGCGGDYRQAPSEFASL